MCAMQSLTAACESALSLYEKYSRHTLLPSFNNRSKHFLTFNPFRRQCFLQHHQPSCCKLCLQAVGRCQWHGSWLLYDFSIQPSQSPMTSHPPPQQPPNILCHKAPLFNLSISFYVLPQGGVKNFQCIILLLRHWWPTASLLKSQWSHCSWHKKKWLHDVKCWASHNWLPLSHKVWRNALLFQAERVPARSHHLRVVFHIDLTFQDEVMNVAPTWFMYLGKYQKNKVSFLS